MNNISEEDSYPKTFSKPLYENFLAIHLLNHPDIPETHKEQSAKNSSFVASGIQQINITDHTFSLRTVRIRSSQIERRWNSRTMPYKPNTTTSRPPAGPWKQSYHWKRSSSLWRSQDQNQRLPDILLAFSDTRTTHNRKKKPTNKQSPQHEYQILCIEKSQNGWRDFETDLPFKNFEMSTDLFAFSKGGGGGGGGKEQGSGQIRSAYPRVSWRDLGWGWPSSWSR